MEFNVWRAPSGVYINIGPIQVKLTEAEYDELWTAVYQEKGQSVIWTSCFDVEMAKQFGYDPEDCGNLTDELDDAVDRCIESGSVVAEMEAR